MCPTTTTTTDSRARRTKRDFLMLLRRSGRRCNADFLPPWNIDNFDDGGCWTEIFRFIFKLFCCVCEVFVVIGFLWLPLKRATHRLHGNSVNVISFTTARDYIPVNHITQQKGWSFVLLWTAVRLFLSFSFLLFYIFLGGKSKSGTDIENEKGIISSNCVTVWAGDCEGYVQDRGRFDSYFFISRPWFPHETTPNDPRPSSSSSSFRSCCYFEFIGKERRRRRNPLDLFLWSL
jgi:hypothetical protein